MSRSLRMALALLSIPLAILLIRYVFVSRDTQEPRGRSSISTSNEAPYMAGRADVPATAVANQGGNAESAQASAEPPIADDDHPSSAQLKANEISIGRTQSVARAASGGDESASATDLSAAGRPFPVSESVVEACNPDRPSASRQEGCGRANELLVAMAREPRDAAWAGAMEKELRAYVDAQPENYSIRALECRKTICFIETAAAFPGALLMPDYQWRNRLGLAKEYSVDAFESDDAGVRLTITLFPFRRK